MNDDWIRADWPAPPNIIAGTTLRDSHFKLPVEPQQLNQVHGAHVVRWGSEDFDRGAPDADAIVADCSQACCAVRTADCVPVLLCSMDGDEIAAVHGGWRGLVAGVVEATVAELSTPPGDLLAWFGPAISQSAFEVGGEVRDAFLAADPAAETAFARNERGRWQADLYMLAAQRLDKCGISRLSGGGLCTFADPQRFYSYRRGGDSGRLVSFVCRS